MTFRNPRWNTGTYTITRSVAAGTAGSDGHWTPASASTLSLPAGVQPLSGRALRDLKEGLRADDVRWVYCDFPLYTVDQGHAFQDQIAIPDQNNPANVETYRVTKVEYFGTFSKHYRATVEKVSIP